MSDALWIAGVIFLVFPGTIVWRLPSVRPLDLPARLSIALATGIAIVAAILYLYSFAHIPWSRTTVGIPLLAIGVTGCRFTENRQPATGHGVLFIFILALLTIYGVATARETCGDLIYFWGPKGQAFHHAGAIDAGFLGNGDYVLMHSDYPPLLPLLYAWASLVAHRFSWWGALFLMPLFLVATAFALRGITRNSWYAALLTAILGYGYAIGMVGGAADPLLLLFEVIAIAALTFDLEVIAIIMLAAIALTKVEGAVFVAVCAFAYLVTRRKLLKAILIPLPAAVLLATWILFAARHHLIDSYGLAKGSLHLEVLGRVTADTLRQASYKVAYVPWIATLVPFAIGTNRRRALLPLIVAIGTTAFTLFYYLHDASPSWWIAASAQRVLLTPLACLVVAAAAASE